MSTKDLDPRQEPVGEPFQVPHDDDQRRDFLFSLAALFSGAVVAIVPLCAGIFTFLDPLRRKRRVPTAYATSNEETDGSPGFVRICSLDALSVGGPPQRFAVIDDQLDAWNFTPRQPIGAVYVQRLDDREIQVFNATCPHAGCSVSSNGRMFHCPCHNSSFELDGSKRVSSSGRENPSPRDLDSLEFDPNRLVEGEVWVAFKNFYTGREEKMAKL